MNRSVITSRLKIWMVKINMTQAPTTVYRYKNIWYSILDSQYLILNTWYSILYHHYFLAQWCLVLTTQYFIHNTWYSIFSIQYSILDTQYLILFSYRTQRKAFSFHLFLQFFICTWWDSSTILSPIVPWNSTTGLNFQKLWIW